MGSSVAHSSDVTLGNGDGSRRGPSKRGEFKARMKFSVNWGMCYQTIVPPSIVRVVPLKQEAVA
jgi:hypothetical protein